MFHLDEYVALPESHIASFRKYLKERFISKSTWAPHTWSTARATPRRPLQS